MYYRMIYALPLWINPAGKTQGRTTPCMGLIDASPAAALTLFTTLILTRPSFFGRYAAVWILRVRYGRLILSRNHGRTSQIGDVDVEAESVTLPRPDYVVRLA